MQTRQNTQIIHSNKHVVILCATETIYDMSFFDKQLLIFIT